MRAPASFPLAHLPQPDSGALAILGNENHSGSVGLGATKGVFVTTSGFSSQARDYVRALPQRVVLIDGQELADLMIEHSVGVRVARIVEFKRLDEDFFADEA